jgi:hypothetical protein
MITRSFEGFETRVDDNLKSVETRVNENVNLLRRDMEAGLQDIKHTLKLLTEVTAAMTRSEQALYRRSTTAVFAWGNEREIESRECLFGSLSCVCLPRSVGAGLAMNRNLGLTRLTSREP